MLVAKNKNESNLVRFPKIDEKVVRGLKRMNSKEYNRGYEGNEGRIMRMNSREFKDVIEPK
jgi:hypothetical protein